MKQTLYILLSAFFLSSCFRGTYEANRISDKIIFEDKTEVSLLNKQSHGDEGNIDINYIGCGGFMLKYKEASILIDPFFSNVGPMGAITFNIKLKENTVAIDNYFNSHFGDKNDLLGDIKAILIGHSHYDHLADVPNIYARCIKDSTRLIVTKTSKHILNAYDSILSEDISEMSPSFYIANQKVRVTPYISEHAPHFGHKHKFLPSHTLSKDLKEKPTKVRDMGEGETYNFLIDFLDDDKNVEFRVFSHATAAAGQGKGVPTQKELGGIGVDVLLLCVGNYNQVDYYPEKLIKHLKPKYIVMNHWENFFRPIQKIRKKPAAIPFLPISKFDSIISSMKDSLGFEYSYPLPLTDMHFYY